MRSSHNPLLSTKDGAEIMEACSLADETISTDVFNFHHLYRLALYAIEHAPKDALDKITDSLGELDEAWLIMPDGLQVTVTKGDIHMMQKCPENYEFDYQNLPTGPVTIYPTHGNKHKRFIASQLDNFEEESTAYNGNNYGCKELKKRITAILEKM